VILTSSQRPIFLIMKLLFHTLIFLLTWLTTFVNATPPAQKLAMLNYSVSFSTTENQKLESEVKIGAEHFERSGISTKGRGVI